MLIENITLNINNNHLVTIPQWAIEAGKVYGLTGDTGSGKSTIGKWLADVEPNYWEATASHSNTPHSSHSAVYLLQDAYRIFNPFVTIKQHFGNILKNYSTSSNFRQFDELISILYQIGIQRPQELLKRKIYQISQGEAQRLAFTLGLIKPSTLLIYDEVFSNVDSRASRNMMFFLKKYCKEYQTAAIIISHEAGLVAEYADGVYTIVDGQLVKAPTPEKYPSKMSIQNDFLPILEFRDLLVPGFGSGKRREILCQLPVFSIGKEECVGLYGESGIGKTTFLKGLMGEHPLEWDKKRDKYVKGGASSGLELSDMDIRYLPQSVVSAFNPAYKIKTSFYELQSAYQTDAREIRRLFHLFDLNTKLLEKYPGEMSGGEIQRTGIVSVLIGQPDLILLDESFSSVDIATRKSVWSLMKNEQSKQHFTLLVVSHDVQWLRENMNRVYEFIIPTA